MVLTFPFFRTIIKIQIKIKREKKLKLWDKEAVANGLLNHNNDGRQPVDDTTRLRLSSPRLVLFLNLILSRLARSGSR